jgi:hypothetical protein
MSGVLSLLFFSILISSLFLYAGYLDNMKMV